MERRREGRLEVITGSMFAGKSDELIRRVERARIAGETVQEFKPSVDDRYGEEKIGSHNGRLLKANVVEPGESPKEINGLGADVIAIDEANFFTEKLVGVCKRLTKNGKRVIVSGIDQTFRGEPFEPVPTLMADAESVDKLNAICMECGAQATRNQRLINGDPAPAEAPTFDVGGDEKYEARCRHCHELG